MKKPKGLGRGLDALIPPLDEGREKYFMCPVDSISSNPDQPRQKFDAEKLEELVLTIRDKGVLSPVILRPVADGYQLISGERRWRAARMAGLEHIPALISNVSNQEALELSLVENIQREDLTPVEEARAYHTLLDLHDLTHDQLAQRLGKDRSTITNSVRLLKLPESAQDALEQGRISTGHARCLLAIPPQLQDRVLNAILEKHLTVRATERLVKNLTEPRKSPTAAETRSPVHVEEIRNQLRATLSTQVKILQGKKRGKIVIEYYSQDDLNRLVKLLTSPSP